MRVSEFWKAVTDEFGDRYGRAVTRDLVLGEFDRTAVDAIADGEDPGRVWVALCSATDVPKSRWHGVGRLPPR